MTKRRKATGANVPDEVDEVREDVDAEVDVRESEAEVAQDEGVHLPREAGTSDTLEAEQRFEVRKDGSIAYFSSEAAAEGLIREVGS